LTDSKKFIQDVIPSLISQVKKGYLNIEISDEELQRTLSGVCFVLSWFTWFYCR